MSMTFACVQAGDFEERCSKRARRTTGTTIDGKERRDVKGRGGKSIEHRRPTKLLGSSRRWRMGWDLRYLAVFLVFAMLVVGTQASPLDILADENNKKDTNDKESKSSSAPLKTLTPSPSPTKTSTTSKTTGSTKTTSGSSSKITSGTVVQGDSNNAFDVNNIKFFDTNLADISDECYAFFDRFTTDKTFLNCFPLSVLLTNSNSYFKAAQKGSVAATQILDRACNVPDFDGTCVPLMAKLAKDIQADGNCGAEFDVRNPIIIKAYSSLLAYHPIYSASCMKSDKGSYCFADTLGASSKSKNNYSLLLLPLWEGALPQDKPPDCSTDCTQKIMDIYASKWAGKKDTPLYLQYKNASAIVNEHCGADFAMVNVTSSDSGAASMGIGVGSLWATVAVSIVVAFVGLA